MIDKAKAFFWKHKLPVLLVLLVISIVLPFVIKQALILRYICTIMMYATSVSYTHLDVYKRQAWNRPWIS